MSAPPHGAGDSCHVPIPRHRAATPSGPPDPGERGSLRWPNRHELPPTTWGRTEDTMDASTTTGAAESGGGRSTGTDRLRLPDGTFTILTDRHGEGDARILLDRFGSAFPAG